MIEPLNPSSKHPRLELEPRKPKGGPLLYSSSTSTMTYRLASNYVVRAKLANASALQGAR